MRMRMRIIKDTNKAEDGDKHKDEHTENSLERENDTYRVGR